MDKRRRSNFPSSDAGQTGTGYLSGEPVTDLGLEQLIGTLEHHLNVQHNLCCALESIADGLPGEVRNDDCLAIARSIHPIIHRSHVFEETVLFPVLRQRCAGEAHLADTLDRLLGEHWEDQSFAEEVRHELVDYVAGQDAANVEKLAYMLRGFFAGLRRHIAFEREHLIPMLRRATRTLA